MVQSQIMGNKVFGCIAYIRKPKIQVNDKFDSRRNV
jgi:hypothetical protein